MATTTVDTISANLKAQGFVNDSDTAIYDKIANGVGIPVDATLTEFTNSENRILNIISTQRYGKALYYTDAAKAFQYGDNLIVDATTLNNTYAVIDATKQIVKQAAFEEIVSGNNSQLFLKIAGVDNLTGNLIKLSDSQYAAFAAYFLTFQIPGLPVSIINTDANILNYNALATYYATYDLSTLKTNLAAALTSFKQTFNFNGEFFVGDLQYYIKANVPGMRDFYLTNTSIDNVPFGGSQSLSSGYFNYATNILNNTTYAAV